MPDNNSVTPEVTPPAPSSQDNQPLPGEIGQASIGDLDGPAKPQGSGQPEDGLAFLYDTPGDTEEDAEPDEEETEEEDEGEEGEDTAPPDPKDAKQVQRIMERYKNDPAALAQAVLANQRALSRKDLEMRSQQAPSETPTPSEPSATEASTPPSPGLSFSLPAPSTLFNPALESVSERGYPVDRETGQEYIPHDELGVQYNLPEFYQAKIKELIDADPEGDVAAAIFKVNQMERQDMARYQVEHQRRANELWQVQQRIGHEHATRLADEMGKYFPAPVAARVANHFLEMGKQAAQQVRASGQRDPALADPGVLASAAELFFFNAFRSGDLVKLAEYYAGQIPGQATPQAVSPGRQAQIPVTPPPHGNNGVAGSPALTKDQKRLVRNGMSEADVRKYSDPNFKFDD